MWKEKRKTATQITNQPAGVRADFFTILEEFQNNRSQRVAVDGALFLIEFK